MSRVNAKGAVIAASALSLFAAIVHAEGPDFDEALSSCKTVNETAVRLKCYEDAIAAVAAKVTAVDGDVTGSIASRGANKEREIPRAILSGKLASASTVLAQSSRIQGETRFLSQKYLRMVYETDEIVGFEQRFGGLADVIQMFFKAGVPMQLEAAGGGWGGVPMRPNLPGSARRLPR